MEELDASEAVLSHPSTCWTCGTQALKKAESGPSSFVKSTLAGAVIASGRLMPVKARLQRHPLLVLRR